MADATTPVDAAFARCRILAQIVSEAATRASAEPTNARNVELGLTERGDRKAEAARKIPATFEELADLVTHLAILDLAAAFESLFAARLGTALGEARRAMREHYDLPVLRAVRERLIREADDFGGLQPSSNFWAAICRRRRRPAWALFGPPATTLPMGPTSVSRRRSPARRLGTS